MTVNVQRYPLNVAAGATALLRTMGTYFRLFDTTAALNIRLDIGGRLEGVLAGQGYHGAGFTQLEISNPGGAPVTGYILVADDEFVDQRIVLSSGAVEITPLAAATSANVVVGAASGNLLAANADRRYLFVQNNDAALAAYVNLAGAVATAANGIRLAPNGGFLEPLIVPTGVITAIAPGGPNNNVVVIEGT